MYGEIKYTQGLIKTEASILNGTHLAENLSAVFAEPLKNAVIGIASKKVVWQCINYIEKDSNTGKRCGAKAVNEEALKVVFVKVYNEEFKDKGNFFKAFLANVEKVINVNDSSDISDRIAAIEIDISGIISMKLHKEIDEEAYSREYQRLSRELTDLKIKKNDIDLANLQKTKDISKMTAIKDIIGDGTKPLTDFNDELFEAMVEKVIIRSQTEFEFYFESGQVIKARGLGYLPFRLYS